MKSGIFLVIPTEPLKKSPWKLTLVNLAVWSMLSAPKNLPCKIPKGHRNPQKLAVSTFQPKYTFHISSIQRISLEIDRTPSEPLNKNPIDTPKSIPNPIGTPSNPFKSSHIRFAIHFFFGKSCNYSYLVHLSFQILNYHLISCHPYFFGTSSN